MSGWVSIEQLAGVIRELWLTHRGPSVPEINYLSPNMKLGPSRALHSQSLAGAEAAHQIHHLIHCRCPRVVVEAGPEVGAVPSLGESRKAALWHREPSALLTHPPIPPTIFNAFLSHQASSTSLGKSHLTLIMSLAKKLNLSASPKPQRPANLLGCLNEKIGARLCTRDQRFVL